MILAGAGSGKTRTLVSRIIHILQSKKISPYNLLALTFSNKAAKEMRDRISKELDYDAGALQVTTFHAFCARLLRSEARFLGLSQNFTIYDTSESKSVVKQLLARRGISTREVAPSEVLYFIDELKNIGYFSTREAEMDYEVDKEDPFYDMYLEYEREIHSSNAVDFGGLITHVLELFEKYPKVLERYQKKFHYLLIDEYQDTNRAQFELMTYLCGERKNVCVVGDEDQSIYSWRGADIRNILDFEDVYPETEVIKLEQNYRSTGVIIEAASAVIKNNSLRKGKKMWTEQEGGELVNIIECRNDKKESEFILDTVLNLRDENVSFDDVAIFYRNNAQSRIIEDYLRGENLPYRIVGGIKFYERKEIKDLLAYMRLIVNPKDSLAFSRVINVPTRGVGPGSLRKFEQEALAQGCSLLEIVQKIDENYEDFKHMRLSSRVRSSLKEFCSLIVECQLEADNNTEARFIYQKLLHGSGYYQNLESKKDYESQARIENLEELESAIMQFEKTSSNPSLGNFLETVTLDANEKISEENQNGEISLMTIHGAKGLEFPYVFVVGAEENIFPSFQSLEEGDERLEEERRLFYVAMTRAMKTLYITFAQSRLLFGQVRYNGPSRFLDEIPSKYVEWRTPSGAYVEGGAAYDEGGSEEEEEITPEYDDFYQESYDDFDKVIIQNETKPKRSYGTSSSKFSIGSRVVHELYGEGEIVSTDGRGNEEKIVIKFFDGDKKKFLAKFAPISLV